MEMWVERRLKSSAPSPEIPQQAVRKLNEQTTYLLGANSYGCRSTISAPRPQHELSLHVFPELPEFAYLGVFWNHTNSDAQGEG